LARIKSLHIYIKLILAYTVFALTGCYAPPSKTYIENAEIYHWYHEYATLAKFVQDHKACLGVFEIKPRSRMSKFLNPMQPYTIPQWDGMWSTFQSRDTDEIGQRVAFSTPSNQSTNSMRKYRICMLKKNYSLLEAYN
jgi:hypothetical protein